MTPDNTPETAPETVAKEVRPLKPTDRQPGESADFYAVRRFAERAEQDFRALKAMTPEREDELSKTKQLLKDKTAITIGQLLQRHALCKRWYVETSAERRAEDAALPAKRERAEYELIARVPERVPLASGITVPVYSKSTETYSHIASLNVEAQRLTQACARSERHLRFSEVGHYRQALRDRDERLARIAALLSDERPAPPLDLALPSWTREVTWEDLGNLLRAAANVGVVRYHTLLVDPLDPVQGETAEDKGGRSGFGWFIASIAKQRRVPEGVILREDYYRLLASLNAVAERGDEGDESDLTEMLSGL